TASPAAPQLIVYRMPLRSRSAPSLRDGACEPPAARTSRTSGAGCPHGADRRPPRSSAWPDRGGVVPFRFGPGGGEPWPKRAAPRIAVDEPFPTLRASGRFLDPAGAIEDRTVDAHVAFQAIEVEPGQADQRRQITHRWGRPHEGVEFTHPEFRAVRLHEPLV